MRKAAIAEARRVIVTYALVVATVIAAMALAYYSYRYAHDLARRSEQSIIETNRELAEGIVKRIEQIIVDSDRTLFDLVDLRNLREFPRRWSDIVRLSPAIESAIILDERFRIVPDGYVSKKRTKAEVEAFNELFQKDILGNLVLAELAPDQHRHLHRNIDGRYYLVSYIRRSVEGKDFYIVLGADLVYLVSEVFPESLAGTDARRVYQILDMQDRIVFGHPFRDVPPKYVVTVPFAKTLYEWRLLMAPREAPALIARESTRRAFDFALIVLSAGTIFVGLGVLVYAVRTERRANQLKSIFVANVSHELKTPLSLIRMFGELLATGRTKGPEMAREYAEIIIRESERLSRLIDNVLDFARIERGKAAYEFEVGDLAEVVSRSLDVYRYRLERAGMRLVVEAEPDLPLVRMDENAMMLVLMNLIDNAVKYAAEGKELAIRLSSADDRVRMAVSDRGPGIAVNEQQRVFERFYRGKNVRGRQVRGSGIGLSLVKYIVAAHGGTVTIESKLGEGSTFAIALPVVDQSADEEGRAA